MVKGEDARRDGEVASGARGGGGGGKIRRRGANHAGAAAENAGEVEAAAAPERPPVQINSKIEIMAHEHQHDHEGAEEEGTMGMGFGFRTLLVQDEVYLVEAEVAPYIDEPSELGATLIFQRLVWVDPDTDDAEMPVGWALDIDEDLLRKGSDPIPEQFATIVRQLHELTEEQLLEYLELAQEAEEV